MGKVRYTLPRRGKMSDIARRVREALTALRAEFEVLEIDPALSDTVPFCEHYGYPLETAANAILVSSKRPPGRHAVCVALGATRLDVNRKVRELLEVKRLSFASAEATVRITGMEIGGVAPFALPDGLDLYVDSAVVKHRRVITGAGDRSGKILVNPEVFTRMPAARVVEGLANPSPPPGGNV